MKWQAGTEGVPILPYRLPELVNAAPETPVFICEGEKDCERLAALGFVATTNPMGAGKWRASLNKWFNDRAVFIIPDNDEPGRKHAADIARHLKPFAARVRIVELPGLSKKGGDISDWLEADPDNKDRLLDVATAAPAKKEPCDGAALLNDVSDFLSRFVVYPSAHARVAHTLWIAHTHVMDAWESTPRIAFLSPEPASGKTRALEVSVLLVPNPVEAINVTPAYLFRKVGGGDGLPTILYDEIDTVFGPKAKDNEEVRALLNAGHRRGAVAGRCVVRGKTVETEEIPAYCAVALAGLGWLPETILTRSIIVQMRRRAPNELVQPFRRRVCLREGEQLRRGSPPGANSPWIMSRIIGLNSRPASRTVMPMYGSPSSRWLILPAVLGPNAPESSPGDREGRGGSGAEPWDSSPGRLANRIRGSRVNDHKRGSAGFNRDQGSALGRPGGPAGL